MTDTATAITQVVDSYFAMWNETDPGRRGEAIAAAWSEEGRYLDPVLAAEGPDALNEIVARVQERFPGHRMQQVGDIDAHHGRARWGWELVDPGDGRLAVAGVDYATFAEDGRLSEVIGFFEQAQGGGQ
jgi:hypothetical protein